jgi:hypothetical protein
MGAWNAERMGEWIAERMGEWIAERMGEWNAERMGEWNAERIAERMGAWIAERMDQWIAECERPKYLQQPLVQWLTQRWMPLREGNVLQLRVEEKGGCGNREERRERLRHLTSSQKSSITPAICRCGLAVHCSANSTSC